MSKIAWIFALCTNRDRKIKINNHTIFEDSNSFIRANFEYFKILMPSHFLLFCCDAINLKFGQERSYFLHSVQTVIKGSKQLFIETLRQIYWALSTGFTNSEIIIPVLTPLLLKFGQKTPKFAYLVQKVTERLKRSQNEAKLIYEIRFVAEGSKPQSLTRYLILTLVFLWESALWEKFNFCFSRAFC